MTDVGNYNPAGPFEVHRGYERTYKEIRNVGKQKNIMKYALQMRSTLGARVQFGKEGIPLGTTG